MWWFSEVFLVCCQNDQSVSFLAPCRLCLRIKINFQELQSRLGSILPLGGRKNAFSGPLVRAGHGFFLNSQWEAHVKKLTNKKPNVNRPRYILIVLAFFSMKQCPEMKFMDFNLTKDSSLLLHAIHSLSTSGFYKNKYKKIHETRKLKFIRE
jgi:hypothetical protein